MTSIDIMARRARIFDLYAQGLKPVDIQSIIASEYGVHERTVRDDLQKMDQWLSVLVKMTASSDNRAAELLALNQLIRQKMMNLAETSKHDPSRVGALNSALNSVKNEMVFLQSLGKMDRVPKGLEVSGRMVTEIVDKSQVYFDVLTQDKNPDELKLLLKNVHSMRTADEAR